MFAALVALAITTAPASDETLYRQTLMLVSDRRFDQCVVPELGPPPFAELRRQIDNDPAPEGETALTAVRRRAVVIGTHVDWERWDRSGRLPIKEQRALAEAVVTLVEGTRHVPSPGAVEPSTAEAADRSEAMADRLEAMANAASARVEPTGNFGTVDAAWLARDQRLRLEDGDECASVNLSQVAYAGDFAFIEVGLVHGPLNGLGEVFALRREGAWWRPVARRRTWIS